MKFEREEDGPGYLSDDFGNTIELSDEQIDAMSDLSGAERLEYLVKKLRDPLRKAAEKEGGATQPRDPIQGKSPLEILEDWTNQKSMAKKLGKLRFEEDEDEDDLDDDDEEEEDDGDEDGHDDER